MAWFNSFLRDIINLTYSITANHGWSIVLFTLLIRLVLFPLDFKSRKSMRRMTAVQPKINALNAKYAKDKEKLNQKTAELYKKEKINPMAGCLPMLLQMPILFAMFAVMRGVANEELTKLLFDIQQAVAHVTDVGQVADALATFQLNVEPWLWVKNLWMPDSPFTTILPLSVSDLSQITTVAGLITQEQVDALKVFVETDIYAEVLRYYNAAPVAGGTVNMLIFTLTLYKTPNGFFLLPLLAAVSQFLTTKLTPQPQAAPQQTSDPNKPAAPNTNSFMKYAFPVFSIWICATSNAAFSLYWVTANVIALAQQVGLNWYFDMQDKKIARPEGGLVE